MEPVPLIIGVVIQIEPPAPPASFDVASVLSGELARMTPSSAIEPVAASLTTPPPLLRVTDTPASCGR